MKSQAKEPEASINARERKAQKTSKMVVTAAQYMMGTVSARQRKHSLERTRKLNHRYTRMMGTKALLGVGGMGPMFIGI